MELRKKDPPVMYFRHLTANVGLGGKCRKHITGGSYLRKSMTVFANTCAVLTPIVTSMTLMRLCCPQHLQPRAMLLNSRQDTQHYQTKKVTNQVFRSKVNLGQNDADDCMMRSKAGSPANSQSKCGLPGNNQSKLRVTSQYSKSEHTCQHSKSGFHQSKFKI